MHKFQANQLFKVASERLPGLKGLSDDFKIEFDFNVFDCAGDITYSPETTTFKFKIDEDCGVYIAEGAPKVPTVSLIPQHKLIIHLKLSFQ